MSHSTNGNPDGGTTTTNGNKSSSSSSSSNTLSLSDRYLKCIHSVESDPIFAHDELQKIQHEMAYLSLLSKNETLLQDISTHSILFLALEHYLALAYIHLPTTTTTTVAVAVSQQQQQKASPRFDFQRRYKNLESACNLWIEFFHRLDRFEIDYNTTSNDEFSSSSSANNSILGSSTSSNQMNIGLTNEEKQQFYDLIDVTEQQFKTMNQMMMYQEPEITLPPPVNRDLKIQRFNQKKQYENTLAKFHSIQERRQRLNLTELDEMDGYDHETLQRNNAIVTVQICKLLAFDEWITVVREVPMVRRMMQQQQNQSAETRYGTRQQNESNHDTRSPSTTTTTNTPPLQLTHITQNQLTGQLSIRKEEIRATVFQPGWNQPTMSLDELAEKEVAGAIERDLKSKQYALDQKDVPHRYAELVKMELEDDMNKVDDSAILDRNWDDWKDENPKGSGNKRGDVGDRNF